MVELSTKRLVDYLGGAGIDAPILKSALISAGVASEEQGVEADTALQPSDIGTTIPTMEQGEKADTALQSSANLADLPSPATAIANLGLDAQYLRLASRGYYDISTDFGTPGSGADYTTLLGSMIDACMTDGKPGHIQPGVFNISGPINKTFGTTTQALEIIGFGRYTRLNLLGAFSDSSGNAITINYRSGFNAVRWRNMMVQTDDQSTTVTAFNLISPAFASPSYAENTEFERIVFRGTDGYSTAKHFLTMIKTMRINNVFVDLCGFCGPGTGIGDSNGRGILLDFQSDSGNYAVKYSVKRSKMFQFENAIRLGTYVQELIVDATEMVGGSIGVNAPSGQIANDGISINGSHINARDYGVLVASTTASNLSVGAGTYMILNSANACGISYAGAYGRVVGAGFTRTSGTNTGQAGVRITSGGKRNVITASNFTSLSSGVVLDSGSQNNAVQGNQYENVATPYTDNGTGNSIGVATA